MRYCAVPLSLILHSSFLGDLTHDHNPDFAREFYHALSVVCDDLFFARYRSNSAAAKTLGDQHNASMDQAAKSLLGAMFGDAYTEEEKSEVVDDLLDARLLPATGVDGIQFNKDRIQERSVL